MDNLFSIDSAEIRVANNVITWYLEHTQEYEKENPQPEVKKIPDLLKKFRKMFEIIDQANEPKNFTGIDGHLIITHSHEIIAFIVASSLYHRDVLDNSNRTTDKRALFSLLVKLQMVLKPEYAKEKTQQERNQWN